jgi:hypothetical protein
MNRRTEFLGKTLLLVGGWLAGGLPLAAVVCNVPSDRATIRSAVVDNSCTQINLAAGTYHEAVHITRSLTLTGAGSDVTHITGWVWAEGFGVEVEIVGVDVDTTGPLSPDCSEALRAFAGANVRVNNSRVISNLSPIPCYPGSIYYDNFESGNVARWDATVGLVPDRNDPIFNDGFEKGDTRRWSTAVGGARSLIPEGEASRISAAGTESRAQTMLQVLAAIALDPRAW